jgi:hypothetical protein
MEMTTFWKRPEEDERGRSGLLEKRTFERSGKRQVQLQKLGGGNTPEHSEWMRELGDEVWKEQNQDM